MPLSILTKKKSPGKVGHIIFDATLSENHHGEATLTQFPVEDGFNINDHARLEPRTFTIRGIITNAPIGFLFSAFGNTDRVQKAYDAIEELYLKREPITVVSSLKVYNNMVITSFSIPKDASTGDSVEISVDVQQLVTVTTKYTQAQAANATDDLKDKAAGSTNLGTQAATTTTAQATDRVQSLLLQLVGG